MPRAASENAVGDIGYLLTQYGTDKEWLRAGGKPVLFVYHRALDELSLADWREVIVQVGHDKRDGVVLVADSLDRGFVSTFDGASTYNITGQTQHKSPPEIRAWAHATYPKTVATAGSGKIATVTIIPGYDDRNLWRLPPRPVTDRWGGETYRALWQKAIAAAPDYILITSWNEWHEGSELEASVEYGSRILTLRQRSRESSSPDRGDPSTARACRRRGSTTLCWIRTASLWLSASTSFVRCSAQGMALSASITGQGGLPIASALSFSAISRSAR